jgi:hypothetical protein
MHRIPIVFLLVVAVVGAAGAGCGGCVGDDQAQDKQPSSTNTTGGPPRKALHAPLRGTFPTTPDAAPSSLAPTE